MPYVLRESISDGKREVKKTWKGHEHVSKKCPPLWTGEVVKLMHMNRVSRKALADAMDVSAEWVTMVLNGTREPEGAQAKFEAALEKILENKK